METIALLNADIRNIEILINIPKNNLKTIFLTYFLGVYTISWLFTKITPIYLVIILKKYAFI